MYYSNDDVFTGTHRLLRGIQQGSSCCKTFTVSRNDWLSIAEWLVLGRKGLIFTYNGYMMILTRRTKTWAMKPGPWLRFRQPVLRNFYRLFTLISHALCGHGRTMHSVWENLLQSTYLPTIHYNVAISQLVSCMTTAFDSEECALQFVIVRLSNIDWTRKMDGMQSHSCIVWCLTENE